VGRDLIKRFSSAEAIASHRGILSVFVGLLAGILSVIVPVSVLICDNVRAGDIGAPLLGLQSFLSGHSAYWEIFYYEHGNIPAVLYPFTTMLALYPFTILPLPLIAPCFCALIATIFAYSLLYDNKPWRLLVFFSIPYLTALQSVQFVPLLASAFLLPCLLPVAVLKPQLGIVLLAAGKWSRATVIATIMIVAGSIIIYPTWPMEWFRNGNLSYYEGKIPVLQGVGCILLFSALKWRDRRARMLLVMSLIPQRIWYDQLMLFLIPETRKQLYILLIGSLLSLIWSFRPKWSFALQDSSSWAHVIYLLYIPSLLLIFQEEMRNQGKALKNLLARYYLDKS
jgi:hypothetical protein